MKTWKRWLPSHTLLQPPAGKLLPYGSSPLKFTLLFTLEHLRTTRQDKVGQEAMHSHTVAVNGGDKTLPNSQHGFGKGAVREFIRGTVVTYISRKIICLFRSDDVMLKVIIAPLPDI